MAEIAAGFLGPVIEVAKWMAAPIMRQFNYLCCFNSNITNLEKEGKNLQAAAGDLQEKVDIARNDVRIISGEVEIWLKNSNDIKDEMNGILNEAPNVKGGCLKFREHYSLSKRAKKTTDRLKELRGQCKFDAEAISYPGPPTATQAVPLGTTYDFESRKEIEMKIMKILELGNVNVIGICGMGGLGKTTMAKRIMNKALEEHVFEEVVMAIVSQSVDEEKIQVEIGGQLGLKKLEGETSRDIVQKLHTRLTGTKKILLVLDDVWKSLRLEDLGIPCNHKGCTILLTSRNRDVLINMDVQRIMEMKLLHKEEAWSLFMQSAGACVDDAELSSIAKEVVNECKELPLALKTVGSTLKDVKDVRIWKNALRQLRQSDISRLLPDVYNPLKLSYDFLDSDQKSLFLLCCLYPEDADISIEQLAYFSMGLGIFESITDVEDARNYMCSLASKLKSRSLLLDSWRGDDYVRMHDIVRDVCIFIAKEEKKIGVNDCSWVSSSQRIPSSLRSQNIRLMSWVCDSVNEEFKVVDSRFLEGIRDLYVLHIERDSLTSLSLTTPSLKNLTTLVIYSCKELEKLSSIGELVSLEIFVCRNCVSIKELPREMDGLTRLKVLDLTRCENLQRIGRGIISNLVGLEELKMLDSFKKWEAEDREVRGNARLKELEALTKLKCLEIEIKDPALAAENLRLSSKLNRFELVVVNKQSSSLWNLIHFQLLLINKGFYYHGFSKKLFLCLKGASCLGRWIEMQLLRDTECLYLEGAVANNVEFAKTENIRVLILVGCASMKKMVRASSNGGALPYMERLYLFELPKLEKIWDGPIWLNLKELNLNNLPSLNQLWKSSGVDLEKDYLPQLETLKIDRCTNMVQVFTWDKNENGSHQIIHITKRFPKLKNVSLYYLPRLTSFFNGIQNIEFPLLSTLSVQNCENLNWMFSKGNDNNSGVGGGGGGGSNAHIHQSQEVSLRRLKALTIDWNPLGGYKFHISAYNGLEELNISGCRGSISLFSSSIIGALVNLTDLTIWSCHNMLKVISDEEEVVSGGERAPLFLFPKLQVIKLLNLYKLVIFYEWKCDIELPSLREVIILGCKNMKKFSSGSLATPNLRRVEINKKDFSAAKDLNDALKQFCLLREKQH